MKVLIITIPYFAGHVHPLLGLVEKLLDSGCEVGWANDVAPWHGQPAKYPPYPVVPLLVPRSGSTRFPDGQHFMDPVVLREIYGCFLSWAEEDTEVTRDLLRRYKPDVVAIDGMHYAGILASHLEKIPYACIDTGLNYAAPADFPFGVDELPLPSLAPRRARVFDKAGITPQFRGSYCLSSTMNVVFTTEAFVGEDVVLPPNTHLVGPCFPSNLQRDKKSDFPWDSLKPNKPLVYASMGTAIEGTPSFWLNLALAAAALDVQLVLRTELVNKYSFFKELPGDIIQVPFAPQLELLTRAAAFVTHGGANSLMEAMYFGVPLLMIPQAFDQPLQAHFLKRAGARAPGIAMTPSEASVDALKNALGKLTAPNNEFKRNALRVQESYRARNGAEGAAKLIMSLAR